MPTPVNSLNSEVLIQTIFKPLSGSVNLNFTNTWRWLEWSRICINYSLGSSRFRKSLHKYSHEHHPVPSVPILVSTIGGDRGQKVLNISNSPIWRKNFHLQFHLEIPENIELNMLIQLDCLSKFCFNININLNSFDHTHKLLNVLKK